MQYENITDIKLKGIYLLWRDNKVVFISKSNHLIRRICKHNKRNFDYFSIELINDNTKREKRLKELIDQYSPVWNQITHEQSITVLGTYQHKNYRIQCEEKLIKKYGLHNLSSRKLKKLLKSCYGINVHHNTVNNDLNRVFRHD